MGVLMNSSNLNRRQLFASLIGSALALQTGSVLAIAEPIAVVMGGRSGQRSISLDRLRRVFLALPTNDDDGRPFVPINQAQASVVRARFDQRVLGMSAEVIARHWVDQRLRGRRPPRTAPTQAVLRRALQELPGAISYLPLSAADGLRVLVIEGRQPNDAQYALR
jgi:AcrR family transcriptional regulator